MSLFRQFVTVVASIGECWRLGGRFQFVVIVPGGVAVEPVGRVVLALSFPGDAPGEVTVGKLAWTWIPASTTKQAFGGRAWTRWTDERPGRVERVLFAFFSFNVFPLLNYWLLGTRLVLFDPSVGIYQKRTVLVQVG